MLGWIFSLALILIVPAIVSAANPRSAFRGQIYSFNQLMRLTPAKRAQYLSDLRTVVLQMEKQQKSFEIADAGRLQEMKDQVAVLMRLVALMPQAEAAADDVDLSAIVPVWNEERKAFGCSNQVAVFDRRVGSCIVTTYKENTHGVNYSKGACPDGTQAIPSYQKKLGWTGYYDNWDMCLPKASFEKSPRQADLRGGKFLSGTEWEALDQAGKTKLVMNEESAIQTASAAATVAQPGKGPQAAIDAAPYRPSLGGDGCQAPAKLACKDMDSAQRDKLKADFRAQRPNSCITSGNFTKYRNNVPKPGNCSYVYSFPSEKADNKINCDRGEALCNPVLFCAGVDVDINGTQQFLLAPICVNLGQDMTKTCQAKYQEAVDSHKNRLDFTSLKKKHREIYNQARKATPRTCDFAKDLANFNGLKEKYDELKASIEDRYKNLCVGNSSYQAMFCNECEIIGQQIYLANTKGGLGGCAGSTEGADPGAKDPAQNPAETAN